MFHVYLLAASLLGPAPPAAPASPAAPAWAAAPALAAASASPAGGAPMVAPSESELRLQIPRASHAALTAGLEAWRRAVAAGAARRSDVLTVIDYTRPSTEPRLFVIDVPHSRVRLAELVAHGQGSGENSAERFSNRDRSHASSLGVFRSADAYIGGHGLSLHLDGLEPGFNDHARDRAIVVHGAAYVSAAFAAAQGRLGRSWGCPAVRPEIAKTLIDTIKGGSLVVAYYPDADWLARSAFLARPVT